MMSSIQSYLPKFRNYLRTKANLLGYKNGLPWYEIYATLGECDFNFSIEECEELILKHFKDVSGNLYNMTKQAFDENGSTIQHAQENNLVLSVKILVGSNKAV